MDEFGEEMEGYEATLVEYEAKLEAKLRQLRSDLREHRKLRAELVAKKKATSILATVRALNADPVAYPPRGARPWNATTIRQALERRP
jgi:hypothetical protein